MTRNNDTSSSGYYTKHDSDDDEITNVKKLSEIVESVLEPITPVDQAPIAAKEEKSAKVTSPPTFSVVKDCNAEGKSKEKRSSTGKMPIFQNNHVKSGELTINDIPWPTLSESAKVPKSKRLHNRFVTGASTSQQGHGNLCQAKGQEAASAAMSETRGTSTSGSSSQLKLVNKNRSFVGESSSSNSFGHHRPFQTPQVNHSRVQIPYNGYRITAEIPFPSVLHNWDARAHGGFRPGYEPWNFFGRVNHVPQGQGNIDYQNNQWGMQNLFHGSHINGVHVPRASLRGYIRPPYSASTPHFPGSHHAQSQSQLFSPDVGNYSPFQANPNWGMPLMAAPTAPIRPPPETPVAARLLNQIEYYFSDENLLKDTYLKSKMDDQGWVPITLIAVFPRVKSMTQDIQLILDSLRASNTVEVQDHKIRRRDEWARWIRH